MEGHHVKGNFRDSVRWGGCKLFIINNSFSVRVKAAKCISYHFFRISPCSGGSQLVRYLSQYELADLIKSNMDVR